MMLSAIAKLSARKSTGKCAVGENAADLGGRDHDDIRFAIAQKSSVFSALVKSRSCGGDENFAVFPGQPTNQRRSHQTAMTGNEDAAAFQIEDWCCWRHDKQRG